MKNESTSNKQHSGSFPSDNVTWEEKPTKKPRIKREGNSIEKNCDIHPEISLQQIQNSQADIHKRHVKKKLVLMETETGQIASSVFTPDGSINHPSHQMSSMKVQPYNMDAEGASEISADLANLSALFSINPESLCLLRANSNNPGRQRRNSSVACGVTNAVTVCTRTVDDNKDVRERGRRRLSIAAMTSSDKRDERRKKTSVFERLTMIESIDNEGKVLTKH